MRCFGGLLSCFIESKRDQVHFFCRLSFETGVMLPKRADPMGASGMKQGEAKCYKCMYCVKGLHVGNAAPLRVFERDGASPSEIPIWAHLHMLSARDHGWG